MEFIRKHRVISIIVLVVLIVTLTISSIFARYLYNIINNYIVESKHMYFYSSLLDINGKNYSLSNWDGVNSENVSIDLFNYKNDDRVTDVDIDYTITVDCPEKLSCSITQGGTAITGGTIEPSEKKDNFVLTYGRKTNDTTYEKGENLPIVVSVTSTSPYTKTVYGTFNVSTETSKFSYSVEDNENDLYATLILKNSINYYKVRTAFTDNGTSYSVGTKLTVDQYNALTSDTNKSNCYSATIKVTLPTDSSGNITDLKLDVTNKYYINNTSKVLDSNGFVKEFTFEMNPSSTVEIIFYKDDITQNYAYPIPNSSSVIGVNPTLASS